MGRRQAGTLLASRPTLDSEPNSESPALSQLSLPAGLFLPVHLELLQPSHLSWREEFRDEGVLGRALEVGSIVVHVVPRPAPPGWSCVRA